MTKKGTTPAVRATWPAQDQRPFVVREGPWTQDLWIMDESRGVSGHQRSFETCAVVWCTRPVGQRAQLIDGRRVHTGIGICKSHKTRWHRLGCPPMEEFVEAQSVAKPFRVDPQRPIQAVDLTVFPQPMRDEVRYVTGEKVHAGDWTIAFDLRRFLVEFGRFVALNPDVTSLLDRGPGWWRIQWSEFCHAAGMRSWYRTIGKGRLNSLLAFIEDHLDPDPWLRDRWSPARMRMVAPGDETLPAIYWGAIETEWLREALKAHGAACIRVRRRSWSTVRTWAAAGLLLDRYIRERGGAEPADVTRGFFLDFLAWVGETSSKETPRRHVNTIATVLGDLRDEALLPGLPETQYLRYGENPSRKVRNPKPIPPDVLVQIESILNSAPELSTTERRLFAYFRYGGPRPSEAVLTPLDALKTTQAGNYWIEYYMPKVGGWRRFPIPDDLGQQLADQRRWVLATYGDEANYLFPSVRRSAPARDGFEGRCRPWSTNGLRKKLDSVFSRHDLRPSATTAETVRGGELHRFRHTIATELLNSDWSQYEVQLFLGHQSATMVQSYAKIHDDRLALKYKKSLGLIDKDGNAAGILEGADLTVERLRERLVKAALPNGYCALPETNKCAFRPNPCLDCAFFRTGREFLGVHIQHRDEVLRVVERAKSDGNDRIVELNEPMLCRLNDLIPRIEASSEEDYVEVAG